MSEVRPTGKRPVRVGFRTSMITVFMAVVLLVGLTLVYLSFERVSDITRTAAGTFIDKVAQIFACAEVWIDVEEVLNTIPVVRRFERHLFEHWTDPDRRHPQPGLCHGRLTE